MYFPIFNYHRLRSDLFILVLSLYAFSSPYFSLSTFHMKALTAAYYLQILGLTMRCEIQFPLNVLLIDSLFICHVESSYLKM